MKKNRTIDLLNDVKNFISEFWKVDKSKLHKETRILQDLGIDGDDAKEFIMSFANNFNIDSNGFEFDKCFGPEAGFDPFSWVCSKFTKNNNEKVQEISIQKLVEVIEKGCFF